jgi:hypothetical protein
MTRRDYVTLAKALADAKPAVDTLLAKTAWAACVYSVSQALLRDNPRFQIERFHEAAGVYGTECMATQDWRNGR